MRAFREKSRTQITLAFATEKHDKAAGEEAKPVKDVAGVAEEYSHGKQCYEDHPGNGIESQIAKALSGEQSP